MAQIDLTAHGENQLQRGLTTDQARDQRRSSIITIRPQEILSVQRTWILADGIEEDLNWNGKRHTDDD